MSEKIKKRYDYIDATKGVAILCITFLHFEQGVIPAWLNIWIGLFMISAFYVTSGWVTGINDKPITAKQLFRKRIRQLGIPYLWFSLLIILFDLLWVSVGLMGSDIMLRDIYKTIVLRGIGTLWFLPVLLIGECIFTLIKNSKRRWLWAAIAMVITLSVNYAYNSIWLPKSNISELNKILDAPMQPIVRGLYAWPIIAVGYLMGKKWGKVIMQTNKIKYMAPFVSLIHGVDSYKLLAEINKQAIKAGRVIPCLLQIHIAQEETKFGFSTDECREMLQEGSWKALANVQISGVMGMATNTEDEEQIAREFDTLASFFHEIKDTYFQDSPSFKEISMGMSDDYPLAIEKGSTLIRVGSKIFGERQY